MARCLILGTLLAGLLACAAEAQRTRCPPRDDEVQAPWRPISWKDFKQELNERMSADVVRTTTSIAFGRLQAETDREGDGWIARPVKLCVYSRMDKLRSGATLSAREPRNLAHAQVRFDITEVFARRLYRELGELEERGPEPSALTERLRKRADQLYRDTLSAWAETLSRHDEETDYGRKRLVQKRWERQVRQWLQEAPPIPR